MESEEKFKQLLRELFQSERADLDFGIYRVMNQKREALEKFIENGIVGEVKKALQNATTGAAGEADVSEEDRQEVLDWLKISLSGSFDDKGELKPDVGSNPFTKAWQLLQGDSLHMPKPDEEMRKDVYNNLYTFFARYYDDGDFMCKQRYSANGRYAVPYNGEETLLHWTNKDQYYIKTAEYFLRYEFKLPSGKPARFEMREAELERDNNESNAKKYFIPLTKKFSEDKNGCYVLPFEYRPLNDGEEEQYGKKNGVQKNIIAAVEEALKSNADAAPLLAPPLQKDEGKPQKNGDEHKTLLSLQMEKYVKLNTADFFIHKNLGKFLRDELNGYINKKLLVAEEQLRNNANSRARAAVAQATKAAGEVVIDFLAQLENYQKAIWEKKKFVVDTNYIIILREVKCDSLRDIIANNDAQWQEWKDLNFIAGDIPAKGKDRLGFMRDNPTLPVDTSHFNKSKFKQQWLETVAGLDEKTDGVLFHCDNWQALNLMQEKYRGKVQCVYIDPPYNTDQSKIMYKNDLEHSCWMSLIENRFSLTRSLVMNNAVIMVAIDDYEYSRLYELARSSFPNEELYTVVVNHHPQGSGMGGAMLSRTHEYMLIITFSETPALKGKAIDDPIEERQFRRAGQGKNNFRGEGSNSFFAILVDSDLKIIGAEEPPVGKDYPLGKTCEGYTRIYPIGEGNEERVWRHSYEKTISLIGEKRLECSKKHVISYVIDHGENRRAAMTSNWKHKCFNAGAQGANVLCNIMGDAGVFSYPKSIYTVMAAVDSCVWQNRNAIVLDYFAGSGTTAHAVINLNRKDNGKRKFVLAEMGKYFHTVLVPRIKKIIFTPEWKDGKYARVATTEEAERAPRIVKYHRLESYEDALENIRFDETEGKPALFDDYTPRYMLQAESGKSATFAGDCKAFQKPFNYTLQKYNAVKEPATADLPETFAYLIGLQEKTRQFVANGKTEYVVQRGKMEGKETVVLWRNTENWKEADYQREVNFVEEQGLTVNAEQIFINDESRIKGAASLTPIFAAKMFPRNEE